MAAFPAKAGKSTAVAGGAGGGHRAVEAHFAEEAQAVTARTASACRSLGLKPVPSNTEPVVRLNVKRGDIPLMEARTSKILQLLNSCKKQPFFYGGLTFGYF